MTKKEYLAVLKKSAYDGTFPSYTGESNKQCLYRGPGGKRCAVGVLIPDERYSERLENRLATDREVEEAVDGDLPEGMTFEDLRQAQRVHDFQVFHFLKWDPEKFVRDVSALSCFQGVEA